MSFCSAHLYQRSLGALSLLTSTSLFGLCVFGFRNLALGSTLAELQATTSHGVVLFLGLTLSTLLLLSELQWHRFYVLFGFLMYRWGRAFTFGIAGSMALLVGTSRGSCTTSCIEYYLLFIDGVACLVVACLHLTAIPVLGANRAVHDDVAAAQLADDDGSVTASTTTASSLVSAALRKKGKP
ncbi:hypothetical protein SPRG_13042 [Saprolegnia parasitica CBS 223.65]|uniref:Transmembrane protein n=1 Tax=Saprolegnia parasitica (strain CBS 223.65) TaxID=695850 RepID=A0A067BT96_SAPPC|nr:hypothetical protein SPRG_13042 [Saprolegnia parasitica CBS 223.65]KDO21704.1 hypothetical protein SPRG_13042 [Saprolegnia parasitica CBS 223.65]|eukprot:XP_012207625.1 hypothetical protein SPRG_13042 [Saprolegnia parasitica CBS 223.65]